jgi:transcription elongation factor Elf1
MKNHLSALKILKPFLGDYKRTSKNEYYFKCPKCNHHNRKLAVNVVKNMFHCWVCDYRGRNIRRLIRSYGSYTQLQKWDEIFGRQDLERIDDLFSERNVERF